MKQQHMDIQHDTAADLLPWYVNNTLPEIERQSVEAHLSNCPSCQSDVDTLARIRHAVRNDSPAPLVPPPHPEKLLAALDASEHKPSRKKRWALYAAAAAIVIAILMTPSLMQRSGPGVSPTTFHTATSKAEDESLNFVIELHFVSGISDEKREASIAAISEGNGTVEMSDGGVRVMIPSVSMSIAELEQRISSIEARPEVASAAVVAVQLPVE